MYFFWPFLGLLAQPVSTALQQLVDKCPLTTSQINCEIQQKDIPVLAACFDNTELYVDMMELTLSEQNDVFKETNTHVAMIKCLKIWKTKKRSQATIGALLDMLVKLKKGEVADQVCQCLQVSVCLLIYVCIVSIKYFCH